MKFQFQINSHVTLLLPQLLPFLVAALEYVAGLSSSEAIFENIAVLTQNCVYKVFVDDCEKTQETKTCLVWQQTPAEKCCVLFRQSDSLRYCHITDFV